MSEMASRRNEESRRSDRYLAHGDEWNHTTDTNTVGAAVLVE